MEMVLRKISNSYFCIAAAPVTPDKVSDCVCAYIFSAILNSLELRTSRVLQEGSKGGKRRSNHLTTKDHSEIKTDAESAY